MLAGVGVGLLIGVILGAPGGGGGVLTVPVLVYILRSLLAGRPVAAERSRRPTRGDHGEMVVCRSPGATICP